MKLSINSSFILVSILMAYLFLASLTAATWLPMCDEAWFANPAYNLVTNGFFGTTVLEETATFRQVRLDGINRATYWIMPLYPLAEAAWGALFGFGLLQLRFFSVFSGAVALVAWFYLIKNLTGDRQTAILTIGLLAVDYQFVGAVGIARMDMTCHALGVSALAVYSSLRERSLTRAVFGASALAAASVFTHPLGSLWFVCLTLLAALFDWRRLRFKHLFAAAIPFLLFGAAWAIYIAQNLELFLIQFKGNASDRWAFFRQPLAEIWREIEARYLFAFGLSRDLSLAGRIRILSLTAFLAAIVGILAAPSLRKNQAARFLLLAAFAQAALLLVLDSMKQQFYMIHIAPTLIAILALWLRRVWQFENRTAKIFALGVTIAVCLVSVGTIAARVRRDAYRRNFLPAAEFLNSNAAPNDLMMASAEFWFGLKNKESLTDDYRLGYRTGKRARFVVMEAQRYENWLAGLKRDDPPNAEFIENLLRNEYSLAYENEIYRIYRRND